MLDVSLQGYSRIRQTFFRAMWLGSALIFPLFFLEYAYEMTLVLQWQKVIQLWKKTKVV